MNKKIHKKIKEILKKNLNFTGTQKDKLKGWDNILHEIDLLSLVHAVEILWTRTIIVTDS